jgi:sugar lactone lactonase YvrE
MLEKHISSGWFSRRNFRALSNENCSQITTLKAVYAPHNRGTSLARITILSLCLILAAAMPSRPQGSAGAFTTFEVPGAGKGAMQGTLPISINTGGSIAGIYIDPNSIMRGFVRAADGTISTFDVPNSAAATGTYPFSINAGGDIAGMYYGTKPAYHGFLRTADGKITTFDVPGASGATHRGSTAISINAAREITGFYTDDNAARHGFLRAADGKITTFDAPGAAADYQLGTLPLSINSAGDITGTYSDANYIYHGFIRAANGAFTAPIDMPNAAKSAGGPNMSNLAGTLPISINTKGDITGIYVDSKRVHHAFVIPAGGTASTFDAPNVGANLMISGTMPFSINSSGAISGTYVDINGILHGFLRASNGMLTSPIDAPGAATTGPSLMLGTLTGGSNDSGIITGAYSDANGVFHGYVFAPGSSNPAMITTDAIKTVAGNGASGFSGDGGFALAAQLNNPSGVVVDAIDNLYIADSLNNSIRNMTIGIISTLAGNGTAGFSGDGGPATAAKLNRPTGVAVYSAGNIYIADTGNHRIRKITLAKVISTIAGNGTQGFSGDGGPASDAQLNNPSGVAVDSTGNIYIADTSNDRIRKITVSGVISTVAGNGNRGYSGDGGPATAAQLSNPSGVAVDFADNLYIADTSNNRIRKVTAAGMISTVAGNGAYGFSGDAGPATAAQLSNPSGVAVDAAGNLFIADQLSNSIRKVTIAGIISTVAGNGTAGFAGDGGPATAARLSRPTGVAVDSAGNLYIADTYNFRIRRVTPGLSAFMNLSSGGSATSSTPGSNETPQSGYATLTFDTGTAPYGTAVFSFKQNGITVSEAGVPASPPTTSARVFIDYRSGVLSVPGRSHSGSVDINTGIGIVNYGLKVAHITYTLLDTNGASITAGQGTLAAKYHIARFINQLNDVASDFVLPANFQFGSLNIVSDQPLAVVALRMTTNQRGEALFTTTPVANVNQLPTYTPIYFPQLADGGGWTTSLVLLNTTSFIEKGSLNIYDNHGGPLVVNQAGGTPAASFPYSIPAGGAFRLQTDGSSAGQKAGWVQLIPDGTSFTPVGSGVFGYNPDNVLTTESGIPSALSTTHARIFVDLTSNHNTGLAIANLNTTAANVAINAFQTDGVTPASTSPGSMPLSGFGHDAQFATQLISGLPADYAGVLDISSPTPFAAITVRSLSNERGDFLLTTFPIADATQWASMPIVFPHIADGGGYRTQFILIGPTGAATTTLNLYGEDGKPLPIGK